MSGKPIKKKKRAKKSVKLILRHNEATLVTYEMMDNSAPIFVGRSRDCALKVPSDESSVSGKHAQIFWKGSKLFIEDAGSRNGIFHEGAQVTKPCRMRMGDLFALGNCQISVGEIKKLGKDSASTFHRLEFLNGDRAGKSVEIRPKDGRTDFSIGLDPACDICLPDMLVSRKHAVLKMRDGGECWIEDLGSRNGTYVHGEKLSGKERLLKDGDKITIAYFDFRFLDKNARHTRVYAWVKLAAIALTVCAVVAAYVFWTITRQPVDVYMAKARKLATAGDFASARQMLSDSLSSRDAMDVRDQIDALAGQVDLWEKTSEDWEAARNDMAAGRLRKARATLDRLNAGPLDSWVWNAEKAADVQKEARFAGDALRLYYNGREIIDAAGNGAKIGSDVLVRESMGKVSQFFSETNASALERDYLKPVTDELRKLFDELKVICDGFGKIDACLAQISVTHPDFHPVMAEFDRLSKDKSMTPAVREYLHQQLDPCRALMKVQDFIEKEFELLTALDFEGVKDIGKDIKIPDQEICIRQTKYSDSRATFIERHEMLQKEAVALRTMVNGLRASGITKDSKGDVLEAFTSAENWRKVLSFDCLKRRPPSPRRKEPSGLYDELLGIEHTYESLSALPNTYNGRSIRMVGFTPKCQIARQAFEKAELFVRYLDNADKKFLQRGDLGRFYTQCVKVAIDREKMVSVLKSIKGSSRARLVAAYYAEYFTARPSYSARRSLETQFKALVREVAELGDIYANETDPDKQIVVRKKILETGLPGDPVLHPKWVQEYY